MHYCLRILVNNAPEESGMLPILYELMVTIFKNTIFDRSKTIFYLEFCSLKINSSDEIFTAIKVKEGT